MKQYIINLYKAYPKTSLWFVLSILGVSMPFLVLFSTDSFFRIGQLIYLLSLGSLMVLSLVILFRSIRKAMYNSKTTQASFEKTDYFLYRSINYSNAAWLIIPFFLIIDFIILIGSPNEVIMVVLMPTIVGGGAGAFLLWIGNKDKAVYITKNKLVIKIN